MIEIGRIVRLFCLLAILLIQVPSSTLAQADSPPVQIEATTETRLDFPLGIEFRASLATPSESSLERVELYFRPLLDETLHLAVVEAGSVVDTEDGFDVDVMLDLQSDFIPSGIDLTYFWRVTTADATVMQSEPEFTTWSDTRFEWQVYETEQIRLFTYELSDGFATSVAEQAQATVTSLEQRFGIAQSQPIALWIYGNGTDFQATLQTNSREAVAGVSYPGYYVVKAVLREGDDREVGRTITHEVSHQVLSQATQNPYSVPPLWFDEGMATHAQTTGIDSYLPLAVTSAKVGSLFRLDSLTQDFPFQPADAAIAYAASRSAVEYILQSWGDEGIARLITQYATGTPPAIALENALDMTIDEFDTALRNWLLGHETSVRL